MKALLHFAKNWGEFILPFVIVGIAALWFWYQRRLRTRYYVKETLQKHSLINDHSKIYRNKIKWPNKEAESFKNEINLLCMLFQNNRIVDFETKNHTVVFTQAKFPRKISLNLKPTSMEVGCGEDGKPFSILDDTLLVRVKSGGGKSVLYNGIIFSYWKSRPQSSFEIIISDKHQSFSRLDSVDGITVFDVSTLEEKERFLEKLKAVKEYQREIDLSFYETLSEAQANGHASDKKSFLILVDEFSESFSNANSKENDYAVNKEIIATLKAIITSARKYGQKVIIAYQSPLNSEALIHPSIFSGEVFGYVKGGVADAKGLPIHHPLLRESGTMYLSSNRYPSKFFKTAFVEKKNLLDLLKGPKR